MEIRRTETKQIGYAGTRSETYVLYGFVGGNDLDKILLLMVKNNWLEWRSEVFPTSRYGSQYFHWKIIGTELVLLISGDIIDELTEAKRLQIAEDAERYFNEARETVKRIYGVVVNMAELKQIAGKEEYCQIQRMAKIIDELGQRMQNLQETVENNRDGLTKRVCLLERDVDELDEDKECKQPAPRAKRWWEVWR